MITIKFPSKVQIDLHIPTGHITKGYTEKEMLEYAREYNKVVLDQLSELKNNQALLLKSLEWFVENDDTIIGKPDNEYWEDGLNEGIRVIALVKGELQ